MKRSILALLLLLSLNVITHQVAVASSLVSNHYAKPHDQMIDITVMLSWNHQFQFAGFYAAKMQGFYKDAGLNVTLNSWDRKNVVDTVVQGKADIGLGYSNLIAYYIKGRQIQLLFASFQHSPFVLLSHQPITELSALKNYTIPNSNFFELLWLLYKTGYPLSDFNLVADEANLQNFIDNKHYVYMAYETNEPFRLQQKNIPFYMTDLRLFGVDSYGDIAFTSKEFAQQNPHALQRFTQATLQGWQYALDNPIKVVDYIIANYQVKKDRQALLDEAARTAKYVDIKVVPIGDLNLNKIKVIAEKMQHIGMVSTQELLEADFDNIIFTNTSILLTAEEKAYLKNNPVIRVGNEINWRPIEYVNNDGEFRGIVADLFSIMEERLNVRFDFTTDAIWAEVMTKAKRGEVDILSAAVATPERQHYLRFTTTYLDFPKVLLAQKHVAYIHSLEKLENKTLAVINKYSTHFYLKRNYPNINLLPVKDIEAGIKAVQEGRALAYIDNIATINFYLKRNEITGLKIVGHTPLPSGLSIAVQKDNPILFSIMQKALNSISTHEKEEIINQWSNFKVIKKTDYKPLIIVISIAIIIILLLLMFVLYLYKLRQQHKKFKNKIHELTCVTISCEKQNLLWVSDCFCQLIGLNKEIIIGKSEWQFYTKEMREAYAKEINMHAKNMQVWQGELKGYTANGDVFWVKEIRTPEIVNSKIKVTVSREIITEHKALAAVAIIDDLTGLYNRRHFTKILAQKVNSREEYLYLALIDIDFFKLINDSYGHPVGDKTLQTVAQALKKHFHRVDDFVFRIGGEEFFILSTFKSQQEFDNYLNKIREYIQNLNIENIETELGVLTISVGAGVFKLGKNNSADDMFHAIDKALYYAKNNGRNQVCFVDNFPKGEENTLK